jgi:hypothetical protein
MKKRSFGFMMLCIKKYPGRADLIGGSRRRINQRLVLMFILSKEKFVGVIYIVLFGKKIPLTH